MGKRRPKTLKGGRPGGPGKSRRKEGKREDARFPH
jgi:hypothetical protein